MKPASSGDPTVLVLTDAEATAQLLPALLAEEGLPAQVGRAEANEALKAVAERRPQVVVIADTIDDPAATVAALDAAAPEIPQLVILPESDLRRVEACSLAGARATLLKPFDHQTLVAAIRQVHAREQRRQHQVAEVLDPSAPRRQRPRVVAVHGAKGGVGGTTLACNLAVALHRRTGRRVALVDGDLLSGDAGVLCDLPPSQSIAELLPELLELDAEVVDSFFQEHESGVRVLLAPEQLQRAESIAGEDVQRMIAALRPYFDYQVVDTPAHIGLVTLGILDEADLIVLVVTPDLVTLRNAARFLQLAAQLGYPDEKLLLVTNRVDDGKYITPAVVKEHLQRAVDVAIPSDLPALVECMNQGDLLMLADPGHPVAEGIARLATEIARRFGWDPGAQGAQEAVAMATREGAGTGAPAGGSARPPGRASTLVAAGQRLARWLPLSPGRRRDAAGA